MPPPTRPSLRSRCVSGGVRLHPDLERSLALRLHGAWPSQTGSWRERHHHQWRALSGRGRGHHQVRRARGRLYPCGSAACGHRGSVLAKHPAAGPYLGLCSGPAGRRAGGGVARPDAEFPLLESYIDIVVEGGLEYGPEFARELIETTAGWSQYWLNDRELARRPWVHDAKSAVVDRMLASIGPAAPQFKDRLFAEQYAVRWSESLSRCAGGLTGC